MNHEDRNANDIYKNHNPNDSAPLIGVCTIIGNDVCNPDGEDLGTIKDSHTGYHQWQSLLCGSIFWRYVWYRKQAICGTLACIKARRSKKLCVKYG